MDTPPPQPKPSSQRGWFVIGLLVALFAGGLWWLASQRSPIELAFDRIETRMPAREVRSMLGTPADIKGWVGYGPPIGMLPFEEWDHDDGVLTVIFQNEQVYEKRFKPRSMRERFRSWFGL